MKKFLKILKAFPALLVRIAHVIEHIFCDEVPSLNVDDFDSDSIAPSGPFDDFVDEEDDI